MDITNHPFTDITLHVHITVLPTGKLHQYLIDIKNL